MARFPYYKSNVAALGKLLAEAKLDPEKRRRLQNDPSGELRKIGLPEQTTALFNFEVVEEDPDAKCVTIPFRLNSNKLDQNDPGYLEAVGTMLSRRQAN